ncbi:hypothetical protein ACFL6C_08695 [Myxococcota bacterium]
MTGDRTWRWPLVAALAGTACGGDNVGPIARIDLTPGMMCESATNTPVIVSGRFSLSTDGPSDDLEYAWSFSRPPVETRKGNVDERELVVTFTTRAAVKIRLRVRDIEGREAHREQILGLTRTQVVSCDEGCEAHEVCTQVGGDNLCVDDAECSDDEECGCLRCREDDADVRRCLPPK